MYFFKIFSIVVKIGYKGTTNFPNMQISLIFFLFFLRMSKKSSTFAPKLVIQNHKTPNKYTDMKKFFTFFLALTASVSLAFAYSAQGTYKEDPNFTWMFEDGLLTVNGKGEMPWYGEMGGPWANVIKTNDIKAAVFTEAL